MQELELKFDESVWTAYKAVWSVAQETCPVAYSGSLGTGIAGGYSPSGRFIVLAREDQAGRFEPQPNSDREMIFEACIILHELSHAHSHLLCGSDDRYEAYRKALTLWNLVNMDGTLLNDSERKLIFQEEALVEERGLRLTTSIAPSFQEQYTASMFENLGAYSTLLWTGRWPNGMRQMWEGSEVYKQAVQHAATIGLHLPPPRVE